MTSHSRLTSRLNMVVSTLSLLLSAGGCGDDTCDEVEAPARFEVTAAEAGTMEIQVDDKPLPVDNQALMRFHASGEENGLWISFREGADKTSCASTATGSNDYCSILMPVQPGQRFQMGLRGQKAGRYVVEGELYDYTNDESLLRSPVCRVHSQITVMP